LMASFDSSLLGVTVTVGAMHIEPMMARIEVEDVTVQNPAGYRSPFLLHADRVVLDLDLQKLILSVGQDVDVQELVMSGVDVIYERSWSSSNLHDSLKALTDLGEKLHMPKPAEFHPEVTLHRVAAKDIGAKISSSLTAGRGLRLEVGDFSYEDFSRQVHSGRALVDVVRVLLGTLMQSVLATLVGKRAINKATGCCSAALACRRR